MKRERDSQRQKAYRAENAVFKGPNAASHSGKFNSIGECHEYIHRVLKKHVFISRFGRVACGPILVEAGKGCHASYSESITLAKWGYSEWMCLHEMAHIIQYRMMVRRHDATRGEELARPPGTRAAGHGWQWASIYLDLVRFMLGKGTHDALKASFKKHGVRVRPKIKREPTPAQREAFERFIAAKKAPAPEWKDPFLDW